MMSILLIQTKNRKINKRGENGMRLLLAAAAKSNQAVPARLREVLGQGDFAELRKTAHLVRGMAGNLRANELHRMAGEVEHLAVAGDPAASALGEQLAVQLVRLLAALDAHLKNASQS